jgi:hypothetical protein
MALYGALRAASRWPVIEAPSSNIVRELGSETSHTNYLLPGSKVSPSREKGDP